METKESAQSNLTVFQVTKAINYLENEHELNISIYKSNELEIICSNNFGIYSTDKLNLTNYNMNIDLLKNALENNEIVKLLGVP